MATTDTPTTETTPPQAAATNDATNTTTTTTTTPPSTEAKRPTTAPSELGKLIRMRTLTPNDLPSHPHLSQHQTSGSLLPNIESFLTTILTEAENFMTNYLPRHFSPKSAKKDSPPAKAPVLLSSHTIDARLLGGGQETWFARTSIHKNADEPGTASWAEFDRGLREEHSKHEAEYTPDVQDAWKVVDWKEQIASEGHTGQVGAWEEVGMEVREMVHSIPGPLNNRLFSVVVVTAKHSDGARFIVVQVPVDLTGVEGSKYNPKSHPGNALVEGMYCSIERGELVDDRKHVKWQMATASDAKGVLPMWAQKMGTPGAVVKDVGLFMGWCEKLRSEREKARKPSI